MVSNQNLDETMLPQRQSDGGTDLHIPLRSLQEWNGVLGLLVGKLGILL